MIRLKKKIFILIFISSLVFLYGCYRCSCDCDYCSGCKIVMVTWSSNDSLIVRKKFCSQTNVYAGSPTYERNPFQDSISKFTNQYNGYSYYKVSIIDSAYNCNHLESKDCKLADVPKDYFCECAK
jgi:hypothetical protein